MSLPLPLRNRLAELIVESLHDAEARRGLEVLASACDGAEMPDPVDLPASFPRDWFEAHGGRFLVKSGWKQHAAELCERSRRASRVLRARPLDPPDPTLTRVLTAAALG